MKSVPLRNILVLCFVGIALGSCSEARSACPEARLRGGVATDTSYAVGEIRISEVDGMALVYVPEGDFLMGSQLENPETSPTQTYTFLEYAWRIEDDERPAHIVYLEGYWIDQTEVTNDMYAVFLNRVGNQMEGGASWLDAHSRDVKLRLENGSWHSQQGYENHPIVEVSWYGAQAYCTWAGRRLPTEAEWEKAAGGTDGRMFPWGDEKPTCEHANYDGGCYLRRTTSIGSYPLGEGPYGTYDMVGNVWEWVADWYDPEYYAACPCLNPQGPAAGQNKVIRGGSFYPHQYDVRVANRGRYHPDNSGADVGFRCVMGVPANP